VSIRRLPFAFAVSLAACSTASTQIVQPSPDLRLSASLDRSSVQRGDSIQLKVELKNVGSSEVLIPGDGRCNPALQIIIWDSRDLVVWGQPLPLCAQPDQPQGPPPVSLAPGSSLSAEQCFGLAADGRAFAGQCALVELPAGNYKVGGSFHGMSLPKLDLARR
jgi:hypothetical protein